jgi:hypothetical protein
MKAFITGMTARMALISQNCFLIRVRDSRIGAQIQHFNTDRIDHLYMDFHDPEQWDFYTLETFWFQDR